MSLLIIEYVENSELISLRFNKSTVVIGNSRASDVPLFDSSVHDPHAFISFENGTWVLKAASQTAQISLNSTPLSPHGEPLRAQGSIQIGRVPISFQIAEERKSFQQAGFHSSATPSTFKSSFGTQNTSTAPPSSFGPSPTSHTSPTKTTQNTNPHGITSWDEIAQQAHEEEVKNTTKSDFDRIEAAQKKAQKNSESTSPLLIVLAVVAVAAVIYMTVFDSSNTASSVKNAKTINDLPYIEWDAADLTCQPNGDCLEKAENSLRIADDLYSKPDVELDSLFESYRNYEAASLFLEKQPGAVLNGLDTAITRRDEVRKQLDITFLKLRARYVDASKRKMYRRMADVLNEIMTRFSYKGAREFRWAMKQQDDMMQKDIYPRSFQ